MPRTYTFSIQRHGIADATTAFNLIRDAESWARWAGRPITFSAWQGDESRSAEATVVGRTRLVGTPRFKTAEVVTVDDRPTTHGYRIPARWPVRDYSATVHFLRTEHGGLTVTWSGTFIERVPGTGVIWRAYLRRFLGNLAERLIAHAAEAPATRSA
ncbi:SRPBCC family protein [Aeromicrobium panaciterrae]|uniref:SRPBCC family protein n=1 Tax=Aeromicrobium panaciterrae TaxID=363861 RepID=UPI0031D7E49E